MKEEKRKSIGFYIAYLGRKNHAYFDVEFKKMGLTPGAPFILKQLYNKDGIRQQDICDNQHINKAGVTRILSKLIQAGLIRREPHPTDKRAYTIHLTPKAREMREDFSRYSPTGAPFLLRILPMRSGRTSKLCWSGWWKM